jgi:deoxyribonuclease IV
MRIGAHVPTRGGVLGAIAAARTLEAEAAQIWASNPRAWAKPRVDATRAEEFRAAWKEARLGPLFVHAPYLVNVASPNPEFHRKSVDLARASMAAAEALGAAGLVVHAGAGGPGEPRAALDRATAALRAIASEAERSHLVVELMAGGAGAVATTFPEAARLFESVKDDRLRLCADTCHLFAGGYALDTEDGVRECFTELRSAGLARRLVLVHANDAKFPRSSRRDAHQNIGRGFIGRRGFAALLADPAVRRSAIVCETPGAEADRLADVRLLRELAE